MAGAAAAGFVIARLAGGSAPPPPISDRTASVAPGPVAPALAGAPPPPTESAVTPEIIVPAQDIAAAGPTVVVPACAAGPAQAAAANAQSLTTLAWAPFHRPETGWQTYAPVVGHEIHTACAPDTPGFAAALAAWQAANRLTQTGQFDPAVFGVMSDRWALARPFVTASAHGICPAAADPVQLQPLNPKEVYGKPERLLPPALDAYRRMVTDARTADPAIAADPQMLTVFSAYRDPEADAVRCAQEQNCEGVVRTTCSSHRTGLAVDLVVGHAPGMRPDSSDDANRLAQTRTPAYRWLLANAGRYGFLNYTFEPWHWEWGPLPPAAGQ